MSTVKFLQTQDLPEGTPPINLGEDEAIELYGLGPATIVFVVRSKDDFFRMRHHWSSSAIQDVKLAEELLTMIKQRHLTPGKELILQMQGTFTAFFEAINPISPTGQIMEKPVNGDLILPDDINYRHMTKEEGKFFLDYTEKAFTEHYVENQPTADKERAAGEARTNFQRAVPDGLSTPNHMFLIIETKGDEVKKVADLWIFFNEESKQSFCYGIEVLAEHRGKGYGKKSLKAWEHFVAQDKGESLGLNVFGKNTVAKALYSGAGFTIKTATFVLQE